MQCFTLKRINSDVCVQGSSPPCLVIKDRRHSEWWRGRGQRQKQRFISSEGETRSVSALSAGFFQYRASIKCDGPKIWSWVPFDLEYLQVEPPSKSAAASAHEDGPSSLKLLCWFDSTFAKISLYISRELHTESAVVLSSQLRPWR